MKRIVTSRVVSNLKKTGNHDDDLIEIVIQNVELFQINPPVKFNLIDPRGIFYHRQ